MNLVQTEKILPVCLVDDEMQQITVGNPGLGHVHSRDGYDETPLHVAARNGYEEIVNLLIDAKADLQAKSVYSADLTPYI